MAQRVMLVQLPVSALEVLSDAICRGPAERRAAARELANVRHPHLCRVALSERLCEPLDRMRTPDVWARARNCLPFLIGGSNARQFVEGYRRGEGLTLAALQEFFREQAEMLGLPLERLPAGERLRVPSQDAVAEWVLAKLDAAAALRQERGRDAAETFSLHVWTSLAEIFAALYPAFWQGNNRWLGAAAFPDRSGASALFRRNESSPGVMASLFALLRAPAPTSSTFPALPQLQQLLSSAGDWSPLLMAGIPEARWREVLVPFGNGGCATGGVALPRLPALAQALRAPDVSRLPFEATAEWVELVTAAAQIASESGAHLLEADDVWRWPLPVSSFVEVDLAPERRSVAGSRSGSMPSARAIEFALSTATSWVRGRNVTLTTTLAELDPAFGVPGGWGILFHGAGFGGLLEYYPAVEPTTVMDLARIYDEMAALQAEEERRERERPVAPPPKLDASQQQRFLGELHALEEQRPRPPTRPRHIRGFVSGDWSDVFWHNEAGTVAMVFHGAGGGNNAAGKALAYAVREAMTEPLSSNPGEMAAWLVLRAEERARSMIGPSFQAHGTMAAIALQHGRLYATHVGDCRVYLVSRGQVERLTQDHVVQLGDETALTRAIGFGEQAPLQVSGRGVDSGDVVILCTAALAHLTDAQLREAAAMEPMAAVQFLSKDLPPDRLAAAVVVLSCQST